MHSASGTATVLRFALSVLLLCTPVLARGAGGRGASAARGSVSSGAGGARGGRGGFSSVGARGGYMGSGGGFFGGGRSVGTSVMIVGYHRVGSGDPRPEPHKYELLYPYGTPNRTEMFKKLLVAAIRNDTEPRLNTSRSYSVDSYPYYWSLSLLLAERNNTEGPNFAQFLQSDLNKPGNSAEEAAIEWRENYENNTTANSTAPEFKAKICDAPVFGDDKLLGVWFENATESLDEDKNYKWLYWLCEPSEFCCGFECCPPEARKYGNGFYTMHQDDSVSTEFLIVIGIMLFGIVAVVFWCAHMSERERNGTGNRRWP